MAVDAQLGVVGEVRGELEKEGAKVLVEAVAVELVDDGGVANDPGVGHARSLVATLAGAEGRHLLLRLADEDDPLRFAEGGETLD